MCYCTSEGCHEAFHDIRFARWLFFPFKNLNNNEEMGLCNALFTSYTFQVPTSWSKLFGHLLRFFFFKSMLVPLSWQVARNTTEIDIVHKIKDYSDRNWIWIWIQLNKEEPSKVIDLTKSIKVVVMMMMIFIFGSWMLLGPMLMSTISIEGLKRNQIPYVKMWPSSSTE